jgi:hypothetical protein
MKNSWTEQVWLLDDQVGEQGGTTAAVADDDGAVHRTS